jgi:5-formyltetrahydrofolate cyclo-ligase
MSLLSLVSNGHGVSPVSNTSFQSDPHASVWDRLREVARPDSRLHFDFAHIHPDFEGSDQAAKRLLDEGIAADPALVFAVPDGAVQSARELLLRRGARILLSTYCMRRGFRLLDPGRIDAADYAFAATLDGVERFGIEVTVAEMAKLGPLDLVLTGAAAVSSNGTRVGKSYQYFDIEWGLLAEIGLVNDRTPAAVIVHDVQLMPGKIAPLPREAVPDYIALPSRLIHLESRPKRPRGIDWANIDADELEQMPALIELQRARGLRR